MNINVLVRMKINTLLMFSIFILGGILLLIAPPVIIRDYEEFKDDPKKVKRALCWTRIFGILFSIVGWGGVIFTLIEWLR